jgi:hypothetical protein
LTVPFLGSSSAACSVGGETRFAHATVLRAVPTECPLCAACGAGLRWNDSAALGRWVCAQHHASAWTRLHEPRRGRVRRPHRRLPRADEPRTGDARPQRPPSLVPTSIATGRSPSSTPKANSYANSIPQMRPTERHSQPARPHRRARHTKNSQHGRYKPRQQPTVTTPGGDHRRRLRRP